MPSLRVLPRGNGQALPHGQAHRGGPGFLHSALRWRRQENPPLRWLAGHLDVITLSLRAPWTLGETSRRDEAAGSVFREFRSPAARIRCTAPDTLPLDGKTVPAADSEALAPSGSLIVCSAGRDDRGIPSISHAPAGRSLRLRLGNGPRGSFHRTGTRFQQSLRRQHRSYSLGASAISLPDGRSFQTLRHLYLCLGMGSALHQQSLRRSHDDSDLFDRAENI